MLKRAASSFFPLRARDQLISAMFGDFMLGVVPWS
jgi:hypothetical protein